MWDRRSNCLPSQQINYEQKEDINLNRGILQFRDRKWRGLEPIISSDRSHTGIKTDEIAIVSNNEFVPENCGASQTHFLFAGNRGMESPRDDLSDFASGVY